ncbi:MAG: tRNA (adenosine(37)-N6)-threonylcarbamoyltransferase complex ATPase subunit type 1 TsaE [Candidatus Kerfeldbacteria bacterium]|nr:tRNA (adenosine(37)-N6)-threonylcarbamoyltransferase complex ATPase subunit type 1 TsaE [Candidatus Kerfeldbacteria bacterium]
MPIQKRRSNKKGDSRVYQSRQLASRFCPSPRELVALGVGLISPDIPHVWLLRGPLGAGKTTLVRGILRRLGVRSAVTSPTYTLQKHYPLRRQPWRVAVHIDAYRIRGQEEVGALMLPELAADRTTLVFVEWPERLRFRWGPVVDVRLTPTASGRRAVVRLRRV